ncbi:hypothetical protein M3Y97_00600900 [Aphelenchoides bicaudatus]|nr:hypothetical protein M3Y97_00600900 [Aphelenchoides bicaudatus]
MKNSDVWSIWWRRLLVDLDRSVKRGFHVDPFSFTVLIVFGASLMVFVICMPLICCCAKRRKNQRNAKEKTSEPLKRRYPPTLSVAKFDEFDALSPLIVSPNSSNTSSSFRQKRFENDRIRASRELFLKQHNIRVDESPPPPRRFNGRTVIVPLASNSTRACRPLIAPLLGTPDSRVTSFEIGTTKSCATIPEDDEFELENDEPHTAMRIDDDEITAEGDLISIDRTYISTKESRCIVPKFKHMLGNYVASPVPIPEFHVAAPTYSPPDPPKTDTVHSTPIRQRQVPSRHDTNTQGQSNLSSPEMSSCGFDSMVETAGSDFIIALDVDDAEKMVIEFEESSVESVQQQLKNLQLHRIEEESEHFDEASSISRFLYSSSGSSLNKFNTTNVRMPRSISQQLEFMISNNAH